MSERNTKPEPGISISKVLIERSGMSESEAATYLALEHSDIQAVLTGGQNLESEHRDKLIALSDLMNRRLDELHGIISKKGQAESLQQIADMEDYDWPFNSVKILFVTRLGDMVKSRKA